MRKILLVFAVLSTLSFTSSPTSLTTYAENHSLITAHRGSSGTAPENTLGAFRQAIEDGAGYAELDVQETKDGVLVVMHDYNVRRTTGINKPIWDIRYKELRRASAGAWFGASYRNEKVPTLEEVLVTAKGRLKLNIELKNNGHGVRLAEQTVDLIEKHHFTDHCTVTSFDAELLRRVKQGNGSIKTGLIVGEKPKDLEGLFRSSDYEVISAAYPLVNKEFMLLAAKYHKEVYVWTVNNEQDMARMMDLGVSSIITNYPERLMGLMKKKI
ncbi:glycerophosphodiester phosphodiesterase family protein [Paenibacillus aurantius]|uniref:Glycerophosphodiester phosphodiesterase family protein n=1 Tax=Paenibacillus aurantius TaxID=2918900 RepID=A0AA96LL51_9BACL|nr:glycerophosphodiester phosphodiesterase family protein [Paenibacillus aurantius]WNQ13397.1 glycerophosphodiester phosphodiesterase family protein [Paenibacillus aurantius]